MFSPSVTIPNYHQLNVDVPKFAGKTIRASSTIFSVLFFKCCYICVIFIIRVTDKGFANLRKLNRYQNWMFFHDEVHKFCFDLSRQNVFQNLVRSNDTRFDLIFLELYHIDGFFALAHRFDCPIIGISVQPMLTIYHWLLKNPITFSYIPHSYSPYTDSMNFWQKFNNFLLGIFTILYYNIVSVSSHQIIVNSLLESQSAAGIPSISELTRHLTMVFEESHFTADHVRPHLPNVIDVAGIHLEHENPLPQVLTPTF